MNYNHQESDDQEEDCLEDLVEIVEDKVVPMDDADRAMFNGLESDFTFGSDEEIVSMEIITLPSIAAPQPPSQQKSQGKIGDIQNDPTVRKPMKLVEFDMFSSVDEDQKRKMENDQSRKLKPGKNKEQKTKKSMKVTHSGEKEKTKPQIKKSSQVAHHSASGEKEKSNPQFYSSQKSKSISPSAEKRKKLYYEKWVKPLKSGGSMIPMPETISDGQVDIIFKLVICVFYLDS